MLVSRRCSLRRFCTHTHAGTELHPSLGKSLYIKQWTNCRMGMMGWGVLVLCYAVKQYEVYGQLYNGMAVSVLLMHLYIFKFFL